jgi:DUF4097 and DUF4098 domain-containing protein YvlB
MSAVRILFRSLPLLFALFSTTEGSGQTLRREGADWVETVEGSAALSADSGLRVRARGNVAIEGAAGERVSYRFTRRVRADSEERARRRLGPPPVTIAMQDGSLRMIHQGAEPVEMRIVAPRALREIRVAAVEGNVAVSGFDGDLALRTGGGSVRAERLGGSLRASTGGGNIVLGAVAGSARCTTGGGSIRVESIGGEAVLETGGGDIEIQTAGGPVRAATAGGAIRIGNAASSVSAATAGGPISVGRAKGKVTASTAGGSIQVDRAMGVVCETAGGAIRLTNISGSLRASTDGGNIAARLLADFSESFLATGEGDITVWIPSNLKVTVRAQNDASPRIRNIESDFPGLAIREHGGLTIAEAVVNGGGPLLRLAGAGGKILIRRAE